MQESNLKCTYYKYRHPKSGFLKYKRLLLCRTRYLSSCLFRSISFKQDVGTVKIMCGIIYHMITCLRNCLHV
ncbi:hypothetical protein NCTGTJJY_CDS0148 [Serratia phage 92A1]|nr:hypothetical protein NCTGTJJY_CDS0148 [Serratia phage 92A1]